MFSKLFRKHRSTVSIVPVDYEIDSNTRDQDTRTNSEREINNKCDVSLKNSRILLAKTFPEVLSREDLYELWHNNLENDDQINTQNNQSDYGIICDLILNNNYEALVKYIQNGVNINYFDKDNGSTFLHLAAKYGRNKIVELLLQNEIIILHDKKGQSPVHIAARSGHLDVLKTLIHYGANVKYPSLCNENPIRSAISGFNDPCLHYFKSIYEKVTIYTEIIKLLMANGANFTDAFKSSNDLEIECLNVIFLYQTTINYVDSLEIETLDLRLALSEENLQSSSTSHYLYSDIYFARLILKILESEDIGVIIKLLELQELNMLDNQVSQILTFAIESIIGPSTKHISFSKVNNLLQKFDYQLPTIFRHTIYFQLNFSIQNSQGQLGKLYKDMKNILLECDLKNTLDHILNLHIYKIQEAECGLLSCLINEDNNESVIDHINNAQEEYELYKQSPNLLTENLIHNIAIFYPEIATNIIFYAADLYSKKQLPELLKEKLRESAGFRLGITEQILDFLANNEDINFDYQEFLDIIRYYKNDFYPDADKFFV
ncbi:MAG: ankyrin repeat domain-containing protein [Rickettsiaceae bacterium]|nr:ankyrin repeat domain-containing protein [Rickettsiaceae bacterium]